MTEARRALPAGPRRGVAVIIAIALAILLVGALILLGVRQQLDSGSSPNQGTGTSAPSAGASTDSAPPASGQTTSSTEASSAAEADARLESCRAKVRAADKALHAARDGMGHWSEHVQAQTDANAGKISVRTRRAIWARTRLLGPSDVKRYESSLDAYQALDGTCGDASDASDEVGQQLSRCADRDDAQQPVLDAAADGMGDWKKHLSDMELSKHGQISEPQEQWLRTWRAAPPHIKAYERAVSRFSAPTC
jgi:hypothetical protein